MKHNSKILDTRAKNKLRQYPHVKPDFYFAIPGVGPKLAQRMRELTEAQPELYNTPERK